MGYHFNFKKRNAGNRYCGTKDVAIYACSSDKFLDYGRYAGVKYLTNIISAIARGRKQCFHK